MTIRYFENSFISKRVFRYKMIRIISRERLFSPTIIDQIKSSILLINVDIEEEEAPEEFYDALMSTIMENPVILPSNNIVDKTTILQHLKNSNTDPFTRQELKEEDLVYHTELKEKIIKWKNK